MSKGTIIGGGGDGKYNINLNFSDGSVVPMSDVFCSDLSEDLEGDIGLIEIAGDYHNGVNIQPGHGGNAKYDPDRDGIIKQIKPFPDTKPTGEVFVNWALFPGWQKWVHPYRYGTISDIDYDKNECKVTLDPCFASYTADGDQMDVNQSINSDDVTTGSISGVSIQYMTCNAIAFSNGDEVIVKFDHDVDGKWIDPVVIGFRSNPQPCAWEPWGETLCKNHDYIDENTLLECTLNDHDNLVDDGSGNYRLEGHLSWPGLPYGMSSWYACAEPGNIPISGANAKSIFVVKWNATLSGHVDGSLGIGIFLRSSGSPYRTDLFGEMHPLDPYVTPNYEWFLIGFNGGSEIEFDLAATHLSGLLTKVEIVTLCNSGTIDYWIDYIDFRKP